MGGDEPINLAKNKSVCWAEELDTRQTNRAVVVVVVVVVVVDIRTGDIVVGI